MAFSNSFFLPHTDDIGQHDPPPFKVFDYSSLLDAKDVDINVYIHASSIVHMIYENGLKSSWFY